MKRILAAFLFFVSGVLTAQQQEIRGIVRDKETNEAIIRANIVLDDGKSGTVSDLDGKYLLKAEPGEHTIAVSSIGYKPARTKIKVGSKPLVVDFALESVVLDEVEIVADVAINRETPVAFTNISQLQIQQELGGRDMTMILNSTPGAYATQQGGGAGDSRVNIRGFDQRNVAVMVDGVPVNDMENGQVYWSNWSGLSDVTRTMQVQRGLGASRLALPSVGGTINILTNGIDQKQSFTFSKELGSNALYKTTLSYNSGLLKGGWGITLNGARRTGEGWVDEAWTDEWAYFAKIQKRLGNHVISLGGNGAPQSHGQRTLRLPIAVLDTTMAKNLGINIDTITAYSTSNYTTVYQSERGLAYNPNWGKIIRADSSIERVNERVNFYHKPQLNLSDYWNITENLTLSNVLYASFGRGGGTGFNSSPNRDTTSGLYNLTSSYNSNSTLVDALYSSTLHKSTRYLNASMNDHRWYGWVSTLTWKQNKQWSMLGGLDARYYKGIHYRMVYDLLGGDYIVDGGNRNQPSGVGNLQYAMKGVGDTVVYWNDSYVRWGGLFLQEEYKGEKWSAFLTVTGSYTDYQRVDHFAKRDIVLSDTTFAQAVGYNEVLWYNGSQSAVQMNNGVVTQLGGDTIVIDNPTGPNDTIAGATAYAWSGDKAKTSTTARRGFPGFTVKTGANYNIDDHHNVFMNIGYMQMAPRFNTVFDNSNKEYPGYHPQQVYAVEAGYGMHYKKFAANANLYFTYWKNKPPQFTPTINIAGDNFTYDLLNLDATHKGIEIDWNYEISHDWRFEGFVSLGDWRNTSAGIVRLYDSNYQLADSIEYSAKNIHVGDAAQTQLSGTIRFEPINGLYFKIRYTFFGKNYANYDVITLTPQYNSQGDLIGDNRDRESWKMPSYGLVDAFAGYSFDAMKMNDRTLRLTFFASAFNLLNISYLTDAQNVNFDATSALVYVGQKRNFNTGLRINF